MVKGVANPIKNVTAHEDKEKENVTMKGKGFYSWKFDKKHNRFS